MRRIIGAILVGLPLLSLVGLFIFGLVMMVLEGLYVPVLALVGVLSFFAGMSLLDP